MFENTSTNKDEYSKLMNTIKKMNEDYIAMDNNKYFKIGLGIELFFNAIKHKKLSDIRRAGSTIKNSTKVKAKRNTLIKSQPNYFSNERIAVYTCIVGNYDMIVEPLFVPNNCDFYIFTDLPISNDSVWKKIDVNLLDEKVKRLDSIRMNRYIKMHPHFFLNKYRYSIYVDGNIQIVSDLTEYIYSIGKCGVAAHFHSERDCVYDECNSVTSMKKDSTESINRHRMHLKNNNMPVRYGLIECNVLVRDHQNKIITKIMEEWWYEFSNYSKRDQISLPYVLFKNNIKPIEIATLGNNVYTNPSFRIKKHL
ncbi:DUF616 domain-containing protein [Desemzia sp. RIT804]|uniref:glycosyltransferase domain-containing protein n=1 Tax=Desemzia sp. RIT 804 TaxID=2810209 RepID=UPI001951C0D9|nr:DUF616 domain-containing protein [Desemzia sp. RIT 804]